MQRWSRLDAVPTHHHIGPVASCTHQNLLFLFKRIKTPTNYKAPWPNLPEINNYTRFQRNHLPQHLFEKYSQDFPAVSLFRPMKSPGKSREIPSCLPARDGQGHHVLAFLLHGGTSIWYAISLDRYRYRFRYRYRYLDLDIDIDI